MYKAFLIKYAEIGIKGKNRYMFEDALVRQIKYALDRCEGEFEVRKTQGRIYIDAVTDFDYDETIDNLKTVFGISSICPMVYVEDEGFEKLQEDVNDYMRKAHPNCQDTFKVFCRRGRKDYPLESMEINRKLGEVLLNKFAELKVDVHNPQLMLNVEIRKMINIYSQVIPWPGGMPIGTAGKAMLLLSGGIDSPVAGYMVAKRGVELEATYFHAPPYTSERAKQKVIDLAKKVAVYSGPIKLNIVNFTDVQLHIYEKCPHDELTIIMKRIMFKIAEHFAKESGALGLITGESIGQVSSQTLQSLGVINEVCELPVFRPVIAFDKQDIVDIAIKIDTYETSILPYEDCCTTFVAKHPVTKPNLNVIKKSEERLNEKIDELVETAIKNTEVVVVEAE